MSSFRGDMNYYSPLQPGTQAPRPLEAGTEETFSGWQLQREGCWTYVKAPGRYWCCGALQIQSLKRGWHLPGSGQEAVQQSPTCVLKLALWLALSYEKLSLVYVKSG